MGPFRVYGTIYVDWDPSGCMGPVRKPQASSSQSICSEMVCPVLGNIVISFVQNVASFRQCKRPPNPLKTRNNLVMSRDAVALSVSSKRTLQSIQSFFCLLNRENSCNESCGGRQATCMCFESRLKIRTDEFSCSFRNYSYNSS
jgi:hypothetical protein